MYGAQAHVLFSFTSTMFENDVEMYGAQAPPRFSADVGSLRMM